MVDTPGYTESSEIEVWLSKIIDYITVKVNKIIPLNTFYLRMLIKLIV